MGKILKKIVLTGGPCAGKSSSLELIENYLRDNGFLVYTVQESATELINSGIKPFGNEALDLKVFQEIIFKYQLEKEELVENVAINYETDKEIIILYDRGLIDNKAYIGQDNFDIILNKHNLKEKDILAKYDLVIHLETSAKGIGYTKENNKARSEDKDYAIELDNNTYDAWKYHDNLIKIKSFENFDDKQHEIIKLIESFLNLK